jgi:predicted dehydrogenase
VTIPPHVAGHIREIVMSTAMKIRLGVVGVGNRALFAHMRILQLLPQYEVAAAYSQRIDAARKAATEYGIPHVAETLQELVRKES